MRRRSYAAEQRELRLALSAARSDMLRKLAFEEDNLAAIIAILKEHERARARRAKAKLRRIEPAGKA